MSEDRRVHFGLPVLFWEMNSVPKKCMAVERSERYAWVTVQQRRRVAFMCSCDLLSLMMHLAQGRARRFPLRCFSPQLWVILVFLSLTLQSVQHFFPFPISSIPPSLCSTYFNHPSVPSAAEPSSTSGCLPFFISLLSSSHLSLPLCWDAVRVGPVSV